MLRQRSRNDDLLRGGHRDCSQNNRREGKLLLVTQHLHDIWVMTLSKLGDVHAGEAPGRKGYTIGGSQGET